MKRTVYVCLLASIIASGGLITYVGLNLPKEETILTPDSVVLVWVDLPGFPDYPYEHVSTVVKCNATFRSIVPSPNMTQWWLLVETRAGNISELQKLPFTVTFAEIGSWDNRDACWWNRTKVDPLLRLMAKRVGHGELDVYVFYDENENLNRTEIEEQITTLVQLAKGRVLKGGAFHGLMETMIPGNALDLIVLNPYVTELHRIELLSLRA